MTNQFDVSIVKNKAPDLLVIAGQLTTLKRVSITNGGEHAGPCPFCGGTDRFVVQPHTTEPRWLCRNCTDGKWRDVIDFIERRDGITFMEACRSIMGGVTSISPEEEERIRSEQTRRYSEQQAERQAELQRLINRFTQEEIWTALNQSMTMQHRSWWESQGIPSDWQDYLRLGFTPDKPYIKKDTGNLSHSPAFTIPYFHYSVTQTTEFKTMQYRLFDAGADDRYRFEKGLGSTFYMTTPTIPLTSKAVICEGAKKGMVVRIHAYDNDEGVTVLSVPSKADWGGIVDYVKDCERVWIALDPDATSQAYKLAQSIGKASRVIELSVKADDAFTLYQATASDWNKACRNAVKI